MIKHFTLSDNKNYFIILLITGLIISSVSLIYPFGRDQGIYAYIGKLIINGKIDYKYSFNLRPPGIHYIFALGNLLFGDNFTGMRILDMVFQITTSFFIYFIIRKLNINKLTALICSTLYIFLYYRLSYWHTLQTESFMNYFICLSVLLLLYNKNNIRYFTSGLAFSIVLILKYTFIMYLPLFVLLILIFDNSDIRYKLKNISKFIGAVFVPIALVLLYYLLNDALQQMIEILFVQIPLYGKIGYATETSDFIFSNILRLFTYSVYSPLIFCSVIYFTYIIYKKEININEIIILSLLIISLITLIIQAKFFYYHFIPIIPWIVIGTALFIKLVLYKLKNKFTSVSYFLIIVNLCYFLYAGKPYMEYYTNMIDFISGNKTLAESYEKIGITDDSVFTIKKINIISDIVVKETNINDKIYIWGIEPLIYYMTKRECATRFTYNTPLLWGNNNISYQNEFLTEIKIQRPKLILIAKNDPMYNITGFLDDSDKLLNKFNEFKSYIESNYTMINDSYDYKIYKLL